MRKEISVINNPSLTNQDRPVKNIIAHPPEKGESPLLYAIAAAQEIGGRVFLSAKKPDGTYLSEAVASLEEAAGWYAEFPAGQDWNIYFGAAIRKPDASGGGKDGVLALPGVWTEIDFSPELPETEVRRRLAEFPLKPSAIVHSGGGLHVHWYFREPELITEAEPFEAILRGLALTLGGDLASAEISRVLRPAHFSGEVNNPDKRKLSRGRSTAPVVCEHFNGSRYNPSDFEPFADEIREAAAPGAASPWMPKPGKLPARLERDLRRDSKLRTIWDGGWPDPNKQLRSGHDAALTTALMARGYSDAEIAAALVNFQHGKAGARAGKYIATTISNGRAFIVKDSAPEALAAREYLDGVEAAADSMTWGAREDVVWFGKGGEPQSGRVSASGARVILAVLLEAGRALGKTRFPMSLRNLGEASGKGVFPVRKALYLLAERGLLLRGKGDSRGGDIRLLDPGAETRESRGYAPATQARRLASNEGNYRSKDPNDPKISPPVDTCARNGVLSFEHTPGGDIFRRGALNTTGWRVLEALARFGPLAPKELNEKTGIPKRTLTLALKRLREAGAVSQEGRRYTAQEFDAQAAAEHFGTDGRQARQMERHEAERVAWKKAQREHAHLKHNRNRKEKAPEPQAETVPATPPAPAIAPVGLAEKWTGNVKAPAGVDPWTWYRENRGRVIPDGERIKLKYPPTLAAFVREHEREIKIAAHREWAAVALSA